MASSQISLIDLIDWLPGTTIKIDTGYKKILKAIPNNDKTITVHFMDNTSII